MSRDIEKVMNGSNVVQMVGKLMSIEFSNGKTGAGVPYQSAKMILRVNQEYQGNAETSEIPVKVFASQYTNAGAPNPGWDSINKLKDLKTAQNVGIDSADVVGVKKGEMRESTYASKTTGQLVTGFEINNTFFTVYSPGSNEFATFQADVFIMDIHDEMDRDEEPTGRLVVKGGVVGFKGKLNVFEYIAEDASVIERIRSDWDVNDTVRLSGRVRYASKEVAAPSGKQGWGEDMPVMAVSHVAKELVITGGDYPYDEEFAYNPDDIRKANNIRKAEIEQKQIDAKGPAKTASRARSTGWEV